MESQRLQTSCLKGSSKCSTYLHLLLQAVRRMLLQGSCFICICARRLSSLKNLRRKSGAWGESNLVCQGMPRMPCEAEAKHNTTVRMPMPLTAKFALGMRRNLDNRLKKWTTRFQCTSATKLHLLLSWSDAPSTLWARSG